MLANAHLRPEGGFFFKDKGVAMNSISKYATGLLAGLVLMISGCGDGLNNPSLADLKNTNIKRYHTAYTIYLDRNQMQGPKDEKELMDFLTTDNTAGVLLKRMEIPMESLSDITVSERDGQPFKVRWGVKGMADHAIIFEAEGVEGKRMVAFSNPRELDATEYDGYWDGSLKPDAPGAGPIDPNKELTND